MLKYYAEAYLPEGEQKVQVREAGLDKFLYSSERRKQLVRQAEDMAEGGWRGSKVRIYPTILDSRVDIVVLKPSRSLSDFFKTKNPPGEK